MKIALIPFWCSLINLSSHSSRLFYTCFLCHCINYELNKNKLFYFPDVMALVRANTVPSVVQSQGEDLFMTTPGAMCNYNFDNSGALFCNTTYNYRKWCVFVG